MECDMKTLACVLVTIFFSIATVCTHASEQPTIQVFVANTGHGILTQIICTPGHDKSIDIGNLCLERSLSVCKPGESIQWETKEHGLGIIPLPYAVGTDGRHLVSVKCSPGLNLK